MSPERAEALLRQALDELRSYPLGWNEARVRQRVHDICRFAVFNGPFVIPLARHRKIGRLARAAGATELQDYDSGQPERRTVQGGARPATKLLSELDGLGGVSDECRAHLRARAQVEKAERRYATEGEHGGNRREGEHGLNNSVLRMIVVIYCEAHARPGFSENGPLCRFASAIGELALGEPKPFTSDAVRKEFGRMRTTVRRLRGGLRAIYKRTSFPMIDAAYLIDGRLEPLIALAAGRPVSPLGGLLRAI